jgi:cytochrome c-type biogenesis protein CcsB
MRKFFDFLFSMQFAGTLMLIFAACVGTATFIENDYGTLAAKTAVYSSRWFEALLALTAVSLIGSVFKYKLYERKRYSVLFFHLAFVLILLGAAITRYIGWEGTMMIREGAQSNVVISSQPYLQITVDKNGKNYQFDREHQFNPYKKNHFKERFKMDGDAFTLEFKQLLTNASEAVVDAPDGVPMITYVTVDKGQRRTAILKSGECKTISGLTLCLNTTSGNPGAISITYDAQAGLQFKAPIEASVMNMQAGTTQVLSKDTVHTLNTMQLYSFGGTQIVVRSFNPSGRTQLVSNPHESSGATALVFDLSYGNDRREVSVLGGQDMIGQPATYNIGGADFSIAYGAKLIEIPFYIRLRDFQLERYPGSMSPSSFASEVTVIDPSKGVEKPYRIFMNNILNYGGFRFFQSSYDKDEKGTILSVNHDFWGTFVTYAGYLVLAAGLIFNFFSKNSRFRKLAKAAAEARKNSVMAMFLLLAGLSFLTLKTSAQDAQNINPLNINKEHAKKFSELTVQDQDGRMKPINTLSSELLRKIYRKDNIQGLNSDQAFLGMMADPGYWQTVPMVKVSNSDLKRKLGINSNYASFNDFLEEGMGYYKLSDDVNAALNKKPVERTSYDKDLIKVDERVNVLYMALTGEFLNIFPEPGHPNNKWHNAQDPYATFDSTNAEFISNVLPLYFNSVLKGMQTGNWAEADSNLSYIKTFQTRYGSTIMPSPSKVKLEAFYNSFNIFKKLFPYYGTCGLLLIIVLFAQVLNQKLKIKWVVRAFMIAILVGFIFHTIGLAIRWYIAGHAPWSNGYETMIYISWGTVLSGLLFSRNSKITLATTAILASVTLMVANLSWLDPQVTNLVPVLKSYWLVIHVAIITASYSFLGVGALLGFLNLVLIALQNKKNVAKLKNTIDELTNINEMNLIIGVFLVTIGTFLGAVWANESWGRYWGWDPKETWALVTVLVYSFVVHMRLIPGLKGVFAFNFAALIAFSSVLMTYFGVNYYLSGMHSYAAGDPVPIPTFVYYMVATVVIVSTLAYLNHVRMKKV